MSRHAAQAPSRDASRLRREAPAFRPPGIPAGQNYPCFPARIILGMITNEPTPAKIRAGSRGPPSPSGSYPPPAPPRHYKHM